MLLISQKMIYRQDLWENPECLYLYGDNEARKGLGGQAKEMRDEPNSIGIATKKSPYEFWSDENFDSNQNIIDQDLDYVRSKASSYKALIIPLDGIGTGLSELDKRAPKTYAYLKKELLRLLSEICD